MESNLHEAQISITFINKLISIARKGDYLYFI